MAAVQQLLASFAAANSPSGQIEYTSGGTYNWTVPAGVTSICAVLVQGSGAAAATLTYNSIVQCRAQNGNRVGDGGGDGGPGGSALNEAPGGGGGAGGYAGNGGNGGQGQFNNSGSGAAADANSGGGGGGAGGAYTSGGTVTAYGRPGGGVGLKGIGATGASSGAYNAGRPGSNGSGSSFGGAPDNYSSYTSGSQGGALSYKNDIAVTPGNTVTVVVTGNGGARIIWGTGRAYPGTNTADV